MTDATNFLQRQVVKAFLKTPDGVVCAVFGVVLGAYVAGLIQTVEAAARCVGGAA